MATVRDHPYGRFVFQVDFGTGDPDSVDGGFEEVGPIAASIDVIEYRAGNDKVNTVRKLPGLHRVHDVTLKRGVIGSTTLFAWFRAGTLGQADRRNVHDPVAERGPHRRRVHVAAGTSVAREVRRGLTQRDVE